MKVWGLRVGGVLAALTIWQLTIVGVRPTPLPTPYDVLTSAQQHANILLAGAASTTWRLLRGLFFGFSFATLLAVLSARWKGLSYFVEGPVEVVRPIPPIALTPFFIILLGLGDAAQIGLISLGAFMIFYIGWIEALRRTPGALLNSGRSLGYRGIRLVLLVGLPYAWPAQKPIWRLAIATGLSLSVAAEYLGAQGGLGYLIRNARTVLDFGLIGAASVSLGCIAIGVDQTVVLVIDATAPWSRKSGLFDA